MPIKLESNYATKLPSIFHGLLFHSYPKDLARLQILYNLALYTSLPSNFTLF